MRLARVLPLAIVLFGSSAFAAGPAPAVPARAPAPAPTHTAAKLPAPPPPVVAPAAKVEPLPATLKMHAAPVGATVHAPPHVSFPASKVSTGDATRLRALVAGHGAKAPAASGAPVDRVITDNVHLLMSAGPDAYESVLVTPTHVALTRKTGIIDLVSHADAKQQIASGQVHENKRIQLGVGPRGFPLMGEEGPNGTVRLYRQLPKAANGEVSATDEFTSFALTAADAFHPWGEAAQTVSITIPHELLGRIETGELGGTGWRGLGGIAIDVVQEVQIDTKVLKAHLAGNWKDAVKK